MWLNDLTENERQSVFVVMRSIRANIDRLYNEGRNLSPTGGHIPMGAAFFDPFLRADSLSVFLRAINAGDNPFDATEKAEISAREMIATHNAKRRDHDHDAACRPEQQAEGGWQRGSDELEFERGVGQHL